jgi:hypothetical protein
MANDEMMFVNDGTIDAQLRGIDRGTIVVVTLSDGRVTDAKVGKQNSFCVWGNTIIVVDDDAYTHNQHSEKQDIGRVENIEVKS